MKEEVWLGAVVLEFQVDRLGSGGRARFRSRICGGSFVCVSGFLGAALPVHQVISDGESIDCELLRDSLEGRGRR
jgi:hypothetical protein